MNNITDIRVSRPGFARIPKGLNQMTVLFESRTKALEALEAGRLNDAGRVVEANFDWQGRKNWGGQVWITWEKEE